MLCSAVRRCLQKGGGRGRPQRTRHACSTRQQVVAALIRSCLPHGTAELAIVLAVQICQVPLVHK